MSNELKKVKDDLIAEIDKRIVDKIIERTNAELLKKLIEQTETINEAIMIAELGTTYKRTGFHFDKRLEKMSDTIKFFKKNEELSFVQDKKALTHKLIIGDNYDALLNLLIEYRGKINVIYIDPPYGKDSMGEFAKTNYENAITRDNLLSMLYPRLVLARQLLSDDGVIFCSIDDKNQAQLKGLFDEVFYETNYIGMFSVENNPKGRKNSKFISVTNDYCLVYAKDFNVAEFNKTVPKHATDMTEDNSGNYVRKSGKRVIMGENTLNKLVANFNSSKHYSAYIKEDDLILKKESNLQDSDNELLNSGYKRYVTFRNGQFVENTYTDEKFNSLFEEESLDIREDKIYEKQFSGMMQIKSILFNTEYEAIFDNEKIAYKIDLKTTSAKQQLIELLGGDYFSFPKNSSFIKNLISLHPSKSAIVLDFFAGSGTTGQAVLELNKQDGGKRQYILATANEITDTTPNGIVNDVTSKRLKRVMTGECYDGTKDFEWNEKNKPFGDNLDVSFIDTIAPYSDEPFTQINEALYGKEKLGINEKIKWVCENFEGTQKKLEDK